MSALDENLHRFCSCLYRRGIASQVKKFTLDGFRAWLVRRGRGRSANQYCRNVRRWLDDSESYEEMVLSRSYSPNYRRHLLTCLRVWARYAHDEKLRDWLDDVRMPAPVAKTAREPLPIDDWKTVREHIVETDSLTEAQRHTCSLIAVRGIRCGDVLRFTKRDLQQAIKTGELKFEAKGERWLEFHAAPLLPHLEGLLALSWPKNASVANLVSPRSSDHAVCDTAGRTIRRVFDRLAVQLDMEPEDLYAHRFRHTYATFFLQKMEGDPEAIFKLQQQMGWASLETAANYLRRSRRSELNAIEESLLSGER